MFREKKKEGTTVLSGQTLADLLPSIMLALHPVNEIYFSVDNVNPSTKFGGTWVAWGSGKMPVGVDAAQTEFATVELTGGQKQHTHPGVDHLHGVAHSHGNTGGFSYPTGTGVATGTAKQVTTQGAMDGHTHATGGATIATTAASDRDLTSGQANLLVGGVRGPGLSPYITVYMWKRTA